jgi:arginine/lysine/ornithine decarboxylase
VATGHTGYEIERLLAERYAVDVELSDFAHVLANITIAHREADTDRLCAALEHVAGSGDGHALDRAGFIEQVLFNDADQALSPAEAFHAPKDRIPLGRAAGRISAELVAAYPPGIPATVPGERLTPELIEYLSAQIDVGGRVVGPEDPTLATISVVAE